MKQLFTGKSEKLDFLAALMDAIQNARKGLGSEDIIWKVKLISGEAKGIFSSMMIEVEIEAEPIYPHLEYIEPDDEEI